MQDDTENTNEASVGFPDLIDRAHLMAGLCLLGYAAFVLVVVL
jgi:hypothetical protein